MAFNPKLAELLKANPDVMATFGGEQVEQGEPTTIAQPSFKTPTPTTGKGLLGTTGLPITKGILESAAKQQIQEAGFGGQKDVIEFGQEQGTRQASLDQFGNLTPAESERFEIVPTEIDAQGGIKRDVKEKPEILEQRRRDELLFNEEVKTSQAAERAKIENLSTIKKNRIKSQNDLFNARFKVGNTFDSWLSTIDHTFRTTDMRPGVGAGLVTKIKGQLKLNPYYEGFKGGLVEYGAAVGRIAMPGTRASRIIDLFKGSAPSEFSSVSSGIDNAARTFKNAISTDLANALSSGDKSYSEFLGKFGSPEEYLNWVENTYKESLFARVLEKNPSLATKEEQVEMMGGILQKDSETGDIFLVDPRNNKIIKQITTNVSEITEE